MLAKTGYTGIAFPFRFNGAGRVDISTTSEDDFSHIREEIIQVISTNLGERVFRPNHGSELHRATYDNNDITTIALIDSYVREALGTLSDIIEILDVDVNGDMETNDLDGTIIISVDVYVKKYLKSDTVIVPYKMGGGF